MKTFLNRWYDMPVEGGPPVYTRDSWEVPEDGAEIWCTAWDHGQKIKPYGDGCHVYVGFSVFHCDQLREILEKHEKNGHRWGIKGVKPTREQQIGGRWVPVDSKENNK